MLNFRTDQGKRWATRRTEGDARVVQHCRCGKKRGGMKGKKG